MAAAATYEPIATTTLSSDQRYITFSSIPQTYTHLKMVWTIGQATANGVDNNFRFNSDTGNNYSRHGMYYTTSVGSTYLTSNQGFNRAGVGQYGTGNSGNDAVVAYIFDYTNSTTWKTTVSQGVNAAIGRDIVVNVWKNTSAISSIQFDSTIDSYLFQAGSVFTLYGIKAA